MDLKCAKISNHANNIMNPDNAIAVIQGQRGVACLACGVNLPKADSQSAPANIANIITESFMKRPALRQEAYDGIFRRANDRLLLDQSPQFPAQASTSAVFFLKNKFVMATAGDNVIFHFVNGVLQQVFTGDMGADPVCLGHVRYSSPKTSEELTFGKGENTFLICSRNSRRRSPRTRLRKRFSERPILPKRAAKRSPRFSVTAGSGRCGTISAA